MNIYKHIADHFDDTRFCHWNAVKDFLNNIPTKSIVLDAGCGNGKYISVRKDIIFLCFDITKELLNIAANKYSKPDFIVCSCENIPIKDNCVDYAISIAVIHHLDSYDKRKQACLNILNKVKQNGEVLITFWAYEQENSKKRDTKWKKLYDNDTDYLIPWLERVSKTVYWRYYHLYTQEEVEKLGKELGYKYIIKFEYDNWVLHIQK